MLDPGRAVKQWQDHQKELGQGMLAASLKNTQQQRHRTPSQLEGFAFSTSSGHILQHRTLEAGFMGNHVFHAAHDMSGNCTLQIFHEILPFHETEQHKVQLKEATAF